MWLKYGSVRVSELLITVNLVVFPFWRFSVRMGSTARAIIPNTQAFRDNFQCTGDVEVL